MKLRPIVGNLLELTGVAFTSTAGFRVSAALGWLALGIGLIVFGVATERGGN